MSFRLTARTGGGSAHVARRREEFSDKEMSDLRSQRAEEVPVASYPQTYQIARKGAVTPVTVGNDEEVIALRTELELMSSFAQGATAEIVEALEDRLAAVKTGGVNEGGRTAEDIEDMIAILRDAMHPSTADAIARIDADLPQARGEIDMASVEKESNDFHEDVAKQVAASDKPAAGRLSQAFKQAMLKNAVAAKQAAQQPADSSQVPAADKATAAGPASAPQPTVSEKVITQESQAELTAETTEPDPVEAALKEALGMAEETLADEAADPADAGDELGDEGLSVEELEAEEAIEADEVTGAEDAIEVEEVGEAAEVEEVAEVEELVEADSLAEMAELAEELEDRDPVEAALAEAIGQAAEINEQANDPVNAALAEAVEATDPVEAILAETETGDQSGETATDPLEQIMAEQAGSSNGEILPDELTDMLLAGQTSDALPEGQKPDDAMGSEQADAAQAAGAPQSSPEAGGIDEILEQASDHVERNKADAGQNTALVPQDDAGGADVAAEEVAQAIQASRSEIDAIASAFQEATSDLGSLAGDVCDAATPPDESMLPEADFVGATEIPDLAQEVEMSMNEGSDVGGGSIAPAADSLSASQTFNLPSLNMRDELQAVRQTIQTGLERLIQLLDRVDQTHIEAENRLAQARTFQQAAQRAQEVSETLVQAQTDAAQAKAAYESAQRRLDETRAAWEDARQAADDAAF